MADPRTIDDVTVSGVTFTVAFVVGAKGKANIYLPGTAPARDPGGTQAAQSQGRIVFDFDQFEARFDLIPQGGTLPGYTPVITAQNLTIGEDGVLTGQFTATDLDENINATSWVQVGALPGFTLNADGSFSYTPPASFQSLNIGESAIASVVVRVSDTDGNQSPATSFDITVTGASDAPVITAPAVIVTDAATVATFTLSATDVEGDISATGWLLSTAPLKGVATITTSGVDCTYDPNGAFGSLGANDFEDVTFEVTVADAEGSVSAAQLVTVRVTGTAKAPVAIDGGVSFSEDASSPNAFNLAPLCSDPDNDIVSYEMVTQPADMTVVFTSGTGAGTLVPSPTVFQTLRNGQSATRTFTFRCQDSEGRNSNTATFTITINGADDAPVALNRTITTEAAKNESAICGYTDIDSSGLFVGTCFEFVGSLNEPSTGATSGIGTIVWLNATNANIGSIVSGRAQFRPGTAFDALPAGTARHLQQQYRVKDAEGNWSAPATITITVNGTYLPPENFPVMTPFQLVTPAGVPVIANLINYTTDADGDYSHWTIQTQPVNALGVQKGTLALSSDGTYATGRLTFNPGNAFDGLLAGSSEVVTGQVYATDANGNASNVINVDIQVTGTLIVNPPNAQNINLTAEYTDVSVTGQCVATDPDGDLNESGYLKSADPASGTLTVSPTGAITFTLDGDFSGLTPGTSTNVVGEYTASDDGARVSAPAKITITVTNSTVPGVPPTIENRARNCDWQASFIEGVLLDHSTDADGDIDPTSFVLTTDVAEGTLTPPDGTSNGYWKFEPGAAFNDLASGASRSVYFEATVDDQEGRTSAPGRVTITVSRPVAVPQSPPVASAYSFSVDADATHSGGVTPATDVDGDLNASGYLIAYAGDPLVDGVVSISATGTVAYNPNGVFDGLMMGQTATRVFTYTASDTGGRKSSPANITVTINGVASMVMEPMYPTASANAMATKYPFEQTSMSRFMALEAAWPATKTSTKSGSWTDATVWSPSGVPQAGDHVTINYGHNVSFNEARTAAFSGNKLYGLVSVHGTLTFPSFMNVRLRCETLIGFYGSHLSITPGSGIINEISFPSTGDIDVTKDPALLSRGIVWHGTMTVRGYGAGTASEKDPYVLSSRSAWPVAGNTTVTLQAPPVGWAVGDKLIIPRTEQNSPVNSTPTVEDEEVTITAINGAVVTFTPALVYNHNDLANIPATHTFDAGDGSGTGGNYPELAICNFTRNIKFTNEAGSGAAIHRRPHIMLMHRIDSSGIIFEDAEIRHFGRTNKLVPAFTPRQMGTNPIVADSNMKGRYSLHLHWNGVDPATEFYAGRASIKRNSFYDSPGWHVALHRSSADVVDNVGWRAFSHYHYESGDEPGSMRGNIAINCRARRTGTGGTTGQVIGSKRDILVSPHDLGNTGQGFFFQGRLPESYASSRGWNRVYGSEGDALLWLHRGPFVTSTLDFGLHRPKSADWEFGAVVGWDNTTGFGVDTPRISRAQHFQVTGCERGIRVVKANPPQNHGLRTFFKDIIITGCRYGIEWEYTMHYTGQRFGIWMSKRLPVNEAAKGFEIFNNTHDITLMYGKIGGAPGATNGGFAEAIATTHTRTSPNTPPVAGGWGYIFDSILFGTQAGGVNNIADMPTYLATRTGPDGVTGTEDRAFNMTFRNPATGNVEVFPAQPNSYATFSNTMSLCAVSTAVSPATLSQWTNTQPANYVGTITDAYGTTRNPLYYGTSGTYVNGVGGADVYRRYREEMGSLLLHSGYWQTPGGLYFVEDFVGVSPRAFDSQTLVPYRVYLNPATPGIAGNPPGPNLGGGAIFTFNGVKA